MAGAYKPPNHITLFGFLWKNKQTRFRSGNLGIPALSDIFSVFYFLNRSRYCTLGSVSIAQTSLIIQFTSVMSNPSIRPCILPSKILLFLSLVMFQINTCDDFKDESVLSLDNNVLS